MKIVKVINNNIVVSLNDDRKEVILLGKGIGFQKRPGAEIDESRIEKTFQLSPKTTNKFEELIRQVPIKHIMVAGEIISYAKYSLGKELSEYIYVALTDHINFAVERYNKGMQFHNALLWEIQRFYQHEYEIGKYAIGHIKKRLKIDLPEDEAGFIALHIVNAEMDVPMQKTVDMTKMIQKIIQIVKLYFHINLDESSLDYERFLTHLKFFSQRLMQGQFHDDQNDSLGEIIRKQYSEEYKCVKKIENYIYREYGMELSEDEKTYLTVHINRVTQKRKHLR